MLSIFLSYRPGDDGQYALALLRDLEDSVVAAGVPRRTLRTYAAPDTATDHDLWPPTAANALSDCDVFLAICSERYLLSDRCGREWWTFADRCRRHEAATGRASQAIIPLPWGTAVLPSWMPDRKYVADIAIAHDVRSWCRLSSYRQQYQQFIDQLAAHLTDVIRLLPPSPSTTPLPYASTPSAFHRAATAANAGLATVQNVRFVVAAGSRDQMAALREDVTFYGDRPQDWDPYRPAMAASLVERARSVATDHLFYAEVDDDVQDIVDVIDRASDENTLVVLLVDAWSVRLETCREALAEVSRRSNNSATAVVVPVSASDAESTRNRALLGASVSRTLANRIGTDRLVCVSPDSTEDFDAELGQVLEAARNVALKTGTVRRTAAAGLARKRLLLKAP